MLQAKRESVALVEHFWKLRGVGDGNQLDRLVQATLSASNQSMSADVTSTGGADDILSASDLWCMNEAQATREMTVVTQRLTQLCRILAILDPCDTQYQSSQDVHNMHASHDHSQWVPWGDKTTAVGESCGNTSEVSYIDYMSESSTEPRASAPAKARAADGEGEEGLSEEFKRQLEDTCVMVLREPELLLISPAELIQRVLDMKVRLRHVNLVKLLQRQPRALLEWDRMGTGTVEAVGGAMQHGVLSDDDAEWSRQFIQLQLYRTKHGHVHVGCCDFDGAADTLGRWARKQRWDFCKGSLEDSRKRRLQEVGFVLQDDQAEWLFWFLQLVEFYQEHGHCAPGALLGGCSSLVLDNWCHVQRVAYRRRVLSSDRVELLTTLGFDWTGADALS